MAEVRWKLNGQTIPSSRLGNALISTMRDELKKATVEVIQNKIGFVRCPEHGRNPQRIRIEGSFPNQGHIVMDCCCDKLKEKVLKALSR
jgi:hypothetical protein